MQNKFGIFTSSVDPSKLASTVEGAIISLSAVIIFIGSLKGITVGQSQLLAFAQQAGVTVGAFGTFIGLALTLFGTIRKIIARLTVKK